MPKKTKRAVEINLNIMAENIFSEKDSLVSALLAESEIKFSSALAPFLPICDSLDRHFNPKNWSDWTEHFPFSQEGYEKILQQKILLGKTPLTPQNHAPATTAKKQKPIKKQKNNQKKKLDDDEDHRLLNKMILKNTDDQQQAIERSLANRLQALHDFQETLLTVNALFHEDSLFNKISTIQSSTFEPFLLIFHELLNLRRNKVDFDYTQHLVIQYSLIVKLFVNLIKELKDTKKPPNQPDGFFLLQLYLLVSKIALYQFAKKENKEHLVSLGPTLEESSVCFNDIYNKLSPLRCFSISKSDSPYAFLLFLAKIKIEYEISCKILDFYGIRETISIQDMETTSALPSPSLALHNTTSKLASLLLNALFLEKNNPAAEREIQKKCNSLVLAFILNYNTEAMSIGLLLHNETAHPQSKFIREQFDGNLKKLKVWAKSSLFSWIGEQLVLTAENRHPFFTIESTKKQQVHCQQKRSAANPSFPL